MLVFFKQNLFLLNPTEKLEYFVTAVQRKYFIFLSVIILIFINNVKCTVIVIKDEKLLHIFYVDNFSYVVYISNNKTLTHKKRMHCDPVFCVCVPFFVFDFFCA